MLATRMAAAATPSSPPDQLAVRLQVFRTYVDGFLAALLPASLKHELASCCREIALLIIGSTGEYTKM